MAILEITGDDFHEKRNVRLSTAEMKLINNTFEDIITEYPTMITYRKVKTKINKSLEYDANAHLFHGVNEIYGAEIVESEQRDDLLIAVQMSVQTTYDKRPMDTVMIFSVDQLHDLYGELEEMGVI